MIGFYPGSFDPCTRGHLDIIRRALAFCPHLVIGVGENNNKATLFTVDERVDLLRGVCATELTEAEQARLTIDAFSGPTVLQAHKLGARILVKGLRTPGDYTHEETMANVNRRLDNAIDTVFLMTSNDLRHVSSSIVREMALAGIDAEQFDHYLTRAVRDALLKKLQKQV